MNRKRISRTSDGSSSDTSSSSVSTNGGAVSPADVASRYFLWILNSMPCDDWKVISASGSQTDEEAVSISNGSNAQDLNTDTEAMWSDYRWAWMVFLTSDNSLSILCKCWLVFCYMRCCSKKKNVHSD